MFQRHSIQCQVPMLVTTNTRNRTPIFADPAYARQAVESLYVTQAKYPFFLFAFVIMPNHCHLVLNVPEGGSVSKIMNSYKRSVSFEVGKPVWQSRFHIKLVENLGAALEYVHLNPVKKHLCEEASQYPWSSASGRWDLSPMEYL